MRGAFGRLEAAGAVLGGGPGDGAEIEVAGDKDVRGIVTASVYESV